MITNQEVLKRVQLKKAWLLADIRVENGLFWQYHQAQHTPSCIIRRDNIMQGQTKNYVGGEKQSRQDLAIVLYHSWVMLMVERSICYHCFEKLQLVHLLISSISDPLKEPLQKTTKYTVSCTGTLTCPARWSHWYWKSCAWSHSWRCGRKRISHVRLVLIPRLVLSGIHCRLIVCILAVLICVKNRIDNYLVGAGYT